LWTSFRTLVTLVWRRVMSLPGGGFGASGQGAPLGHARTAREARRCRAHLPDDEEAVRGLSRLTGDPCGDPGDTLGLCRRADPEDDGAAFPHEWQAPLNRGRRLRERLRDRDAGPVRVLLL